MTGSGAYAVSGSGEVALTVTQSEGSTIIITPRGYLSEDGQLMVLTDIEASFAPITHTISASAGTGGSIDPSGTVTVNEGDDQTFTITANSGYHVADVLVDGGSVGAVTSYTVFDVTSGGTISASFAINTYNISTATQGSGTIALDPPGGTYDEGKSVTLTATAGSDYQFDHWEGDVSGSTNPLTVTVDSDISATAVFIAQEGDSSTFTSSGGQIITVTVSAGTLTLHEAVEAVPDNLAFIYSPMDIEINNIPIGSNVDVTIDLPSAAPNDASVYKLIDGAWVNFDSNCQFNAQRTSVTFQITDGGYGDSDNAADGKISDPIGFATTVDNSNSNSSGGGGGGGCFVGSIF